MTTKAPRVLRPRTELLTMLTYARPHNSDAETAFVQRFVGDLPGLGWDKFGNGWIQIGNSRVLWSCHTDTVHWKPGRQKVRVDETGVVRLVDGKRGLCLGADDAAGVWLMRQMIKAQVPGRYVFHAGEEHGGLGSAWIARERPDLLKDIDFAIALDRKGTSSIITHQAGGRCASEEFSASLAQKLGAGWKSDAGGTFTDTANYTDHIGECTNLSVGYYDQHSHNETLDLKFLMELKNALIRFDPSGLVAKRLPGEKEPVRYPAVAWPAKWSKGKKKSKSKGKVLATQSGAANWWEKEEDRQLKLTYHDASDEPDPSLVDFCEGHPDLAARLIEQLGGNLADAIELLFDAEEDK